MLRFARRRLLAGAAALAGVSLARAQPSGRPFRIALVPDMRPGQDRLVRVFVDALRELGRVEGRDYVLFRSGVLYGADSKLALDRALESRPDLLLVNNLGFAIDAQRATKTIPIVMWISGFPVEGGVADSLARPGRNVTGLTIYAGGEVFGKQVQLLHEVKPGLKRVGALMSYVPPFHPRAEAEVIEGGMRDAAARLGVELKLFEISRNEHVDEALAAVAAQGIEALVLTSDPVLFARRKDVIEFAIAKRVATTVDSGGWRELDPLPLLGYWAPLDVLIRQAAPYVNRILWEGARPGDLPIQLPARFELVVSLKTARAIGVTVPRSILLRADTVIE